MNTDGALLNAASPPPPGPQPMGSPGVQGAISGGLLRPGSIDQRAFLQMLEAQQANRAAAGVGGKPVAMPAPSFQRDIPTLSSAQFAALVGGSSDADPPLADSDDGVAADPQTTTGATARTTLTAPAAIPGVAVPTAATMRLSGLPPVRNDASAPTGATVGAGVADDGGDAEAPTIEHVAAAVSEPGTDGQQDPAVGQGQPGATQPSATQANAAEPNAGQAKPQPPVDPNVVHLRDDPDRETRRNLMAQHKHWVVDETPGARQLFFGPDGEFGWDDFLDVINPLQHIPIVAQIYRAVTGDESYGAADLIGALPFGPLGGIGMIGSVANLVVKDVTGKDAAENLEAMVFGDKAAPQGSTEGDAAMAATGSRPELGIQTASAEMAGGDLSAASVSHDQRKA